MTVIFIKTSGGCILTALCTSGQTCGIRLFSVTNAERLSPPNRISKLIGGNAKSNRYIEGFFLAAHRNIYHGVAFLEERGRKPAHFVSQKKRRRPLRFIVAIIDSVIYKLERYNLNILFF